MKWLTGVVPPVADIIEPDDVEPDELGASGLADGDVVEGRIEDGEFVEGEFVDCGVKGDVNCELVIDEAADGALVHADGKHGDAEHERFVSSSTSSSESFAGTCLLSLIAKRMLELSSVVSASSSSSSEPVSVRSRQI